MAAKKKQLFEKGRMDMGSDKKGGGKEMSPSEMKRDMAMMKKMRKGK